MLAVRQARRPGLHGDGGGLFLQVSRNGVKSWIYRYKVAGKHRLMGLGPARDISLAEAREAARVCRQMRLSGVDPIDKRRAERLNHRLAMARSLTFAECAAAYIRAHEPGWRNQKSARQWTSSISAYIDPVFGEAPIQAVDTPLVMKALELIWATKPETARRLRGRIEAVLDWATALKCRRINDPANLDATSGRVNI